MNYLYGYNSENNSYLVNDYPWGFRYRTEARFWIESVPGKRGGDRFCRQTRNPKNRKWCKPKKSTYSPVLILTLDDKNHVSYTGLSASVGSKGDDEKIKKFLALHGEHLNELQKDYIRYLLAAHDVYQHVEYEIVKNPVGPIDLLSSDPVEIEKRERLAAWDKERNEKQAETETKIKRAVAARYILRKKEESVNV